MGNNIPISASSIAQAIDTLSHEELTVLRDMMFKQILKLQATKEKELKAFIDSNRAER